MYFLFWHIILFFILADERRSSSDSSYYSSSVQLFNNSYYYFNIKHPTPSFASGFMSSFLKSKIILTSTLLLFVIVKGKAV